GRFAPERIESRLGGFECTRSHASIAQCALEHPTDGCVIVHEPDAQVLAAHAGSPRGSNSVKIVRPGSLSNSMRPPLRVTSSCATASPRPVPFGRPVTSG